MSAPNIIFILSDQHRHDALGCAGNPVIETPNLDALGKRGMRFANAWCQSPICQPSRAALITSQLPSTLGVMRNFGPDMDATKPTFMQALQAAGYRTANIGKTHYYAEGLVPSDAADDSKDMRKYSKFVQDFGFDHVVEEFDRYVHADPEVETAYTDYLKAEGVYATYRKQLRNMWRLTEQHWDGVTSPLSKEQDLTSFLTRAAGSWLAQQNDAAPFFLQLSYVQPHVPLMGDPIWAEHYRNATIPLGPRTPAQATNDVWDRYLRFCRQHSQSHLLDDEYVQRGARQYYAMISLIDECIGQLLKQLEAQGQLDNTMIVYSADHGEMLGDHGLMAKFNFYRSSVQVPLIVVPPGNAGGSDARTNVNAGAVNEALVESIDIAPTILEAAGVEPLSDGAGQSLLPLLAGGPGRSDVISEIQMQSRSGSTPTYRGLRTQRHRVTVETATGTACELFDLEADPDELHNLVEAKAAQPALAELSERLQARLALAANQ